MYINISHTQKSNTAVQCEWVHNESKIYLQANNTNNFKQQEFDGPSGVKKNIQVTRDFREKRQELPNNKTKPGSSSSP